MGYPPTSKQKFYAPFYSKSKHGFIDVETHAEGFLMEFPVQGQEFHVVIDVPQETVHGPYMIIFYASFWHEGDADSLIETGLSYSERWSGWNFAGPAKDDPKGLHSVFHKNPPRGKRVELVVAFKRHGSAGLIHCTCSGKSRLIHLPKYESVDKVRLVIAAGDNRGASLGEAGMTLVSIDHKPPTVPGKVEFIRGAQINDGNRRSVFISQTGFGMRCRIPPEPKAHATETIHSEPRDQGQPRPLSISEQRTMSFMR